MTDTIWNEFWTLPAKHRKSKYLSDKSHKNAWCKYCLQDWLEDALLQWQGASEAERATWEQRSLLSPWIDSTVSFRIPSFEGLEDIPDPVWLQGILQYQYLLSSC
jgi:hypothetical protein